MSSELQAYIEALKISDQHIRQLDQTGVGFVENYRFHQEFKFVFDKNKNYLYVSYASSVYLGFSYGTMENRYWRDLGLSSDLMEAVEQQINDVLESGQIIKSKMTEKFGVKQETRYFEYLLAPFYDKHNNVEAVICTVRDITELVQLKVDKMNQDSRFNQLIELCPMGIVLINEHKEIKGMNKTYLDQFFPGYQQNEVIGKSISLLLEKLNVGWECSCLAQALNGVKVEHKIIKQSNRTNICSAIPVQNEIGQIIGAIGVYYDITTYEELKNQYAQLERVHIVSEIAKGVAHEIRNPLTVVKGYLQIFQRTVSTGFNEKIKLVLGEVQKVEKIISNFLFLASNKRSELHWRDLGEIIKAINPLIRNSLSHAEIELMVSIPENTPLLLLDEKEIKQLIFNLVQNGLEAMSDKGTLCIKLDYNEDKVFLSVSDTGKGIEPQYAQKIFDPFFTTKENKSGLGLAICTSIANRHGALMKVVSQVGNGTEVVVRFSRQNKGRIIQLS